MSGEKRKQSEAAKAGEAKLFTEAFLNHFHRQVDESDKLLSQLQNMLDGLKKSLDAKLDTVYAANNNLKSATKVKLKESLVSGRRLSEDFASEAVTGSLKQVLSVLFLVNDQQKQLFRDIEKVKLKEIMHGVGQLTKDKAEKYADQVGQLVDNLKNLQHGLKHELTLFHGKSFETESAAELQKERTRLDQILLEQIKLNTTLKQELSSGHQNVVNVQDENEVQEVKNYETPRLTRKN